MSKKPSKQKGSIHLELESLAEEIEEEFVCMCLDCKAYRKGYSVTEYVNEYVADATSELED